MPYARVSAMPQPPGAADGSGSRKHKGSQQQQQAGITMQDLKKQTAQRLAQEQQRKVSKGRGFRRGGGGNSSSGDKSSDGKSSVKDTTSDPAVATPTKAKSKSKSSRKSSSSRKWTWDMSNDSSSKSSNGDEERSTSTTSSGGRKKESKASDKNSREGSSPYVDRSPQQSSSSSSGYSVFSTPRNYFRSSSRNQQNGYSSKNKSKLPHGLTVHELKEMTKARLAAEQMAAQKNVNVGVEAPINNTPAAPSPYPANTNPQQPQQPSRSSLQQALNSLSNVNPNVNMNAQGSGAGCGGANANAPHPGTYAPSATPPPPIMHSPVPSSYQHQHHMNVNHVNVNASYYSPNPSPNPTPASEANAQYFSPWQHAQQQTMNVNVNVSLPNTAPSGKITMKHATSQDIMRTQSFPSLSSSGHDLVDTFERNASFFEGFSSVPTSPAVPHRMVQTLDHPSLGVSANACNANFLAERRLGPPPPPGMMMAGNVNSGNNRDSVSSDASNLMPEWVAESVLVTPATSEMRGRKIFPQQQSANDGDVFRTLDPAHSHSHSSNSLQQMQSSLANYSFGSASLGAIGSSGSVGDSIGRPRLGSGPALSNEFASLLRLNSDDVMTEQRSMFAFSSATLPTTTEELNDLSNRQHRSYTLD